MWTSTAGLLDNNNEQILELPVLTLSDAGKYTCEVQINFESDSTIYTANSSYALILQSK